MLRTTSKSNCWWFGRNGIVCMAHTPCPSGCRAPAPILTFADRLDNSGTAMWFQTSARSFGTRKGLGQKNKGTGVLLFNGYITGPNRVCYLAYFPKGATLKKGPQAFGKGPVPPSPKRTYCEPRTNSVHCLDPRNGEHIGGPSGKSVVSLSNPGHKEHRTMSAALRLVEGSSMDKSK